MKRLTDPILRTLPFVLFLCAGIVFARNLVVEGGGDLQVYWRIARRVLEGGPTYYPPTDIPMAFKYPPWVLPLFFPFALLPFEAARLAWALLSVAAMYGSFYWIIRKLRCSPASVAVALALTWGIWGGQFNHGQVNALVLVGLLWFWDPGLPPRSPWRSMALIYVATTKIVSVFPLLFFRNYRQWARPAAWAGLIFVLFSVPSLLTTEPPRMTHLLSSWLTVAGSAVRGFGPEFARGRMNQGLPVLFGRVTGFMSTSDWPERIGLVVVGGLVAAWWRRTSERLSPEESWAGWVAWICVIGPLSWSHNFVLALPLEALALDTAWRSRRPGGIALVLFGLICVGPLTFNAARAVGGLMGEPDRWVPLSNFIEHMSIKSIGLLICAWGLLLSRREGTVTRPTAA